MPTARGWSAGQAPVAAPGLKVTLLSVEVRRPDELERAFAAVLAQRADAMLRGHVNRVAATARNPKRRMRPLHRLRLAPRVGQREELTVEGGDVLGQQAADALDGLGHLASLPPRGPGHFVAEVLLELVRQHHHPRQ